MQEEWEAVFGLEIHAQLNTKSKLFSRAPNRFGGDPNTNITEVCTGQPGALPMLNREAVKKAVQFGCAVQGQIAKFIKFDRKIHFYPDSPCNFQITQYEHPIVLGGTVVAGVEGEEKSFAIHRVCLKEDVGILKHFATCAGVDYNRAGVPLLEIISEPCMHTPKEAAAYAMAVKAILGSLGISDCNMDEGSLRIEANVSVRLRGETSLRNKTKIKDMSSFSHVELALKSEVVRQISAYTAHSALPLKEIIPRCTYRWDAEQKKTMLIPAKEEADDYRHFPELDLAPIVLTDEYIEKIRKQLLGLLT